MTAGRVFVTGLGVVSAVGPDTASFWDACLRGDTRVEPIPEHWALYYAAASRVWSPLPMAAVEGRFRRTDRLTLDRIVLLAIHAADEAVRSAGLAIESAAPGDERHRIGGIAPQRAAVYVGTGFGGAQAAFDNHLTHLLAPVRAALAQAPADAAAAPLLADLQRALAAHPRVHPFVICQSMPNACAAHLGIRFGFKGLNDTACFACASGTVAIGRAFHALRNGRHDVCIAGGVEHLDDHAGSVFMGFDRLRTLARPANPPGTENRPFDAARSGFLFSEGGAGFLVLESERHAARRGARPIAEIVGFGATSDATSIVAIAEDDNTLDAMLAATLDDAGVAAECIGYVNAHGTATPLNDALEAAFIARALPHRPVVNSTKAILGHTIGACGALEATVAVLSLRDQRVHGMPNLAEPVGDLDYARTAREVSIEYALSQNFGFGGHNAALLFKRLP